MDMICRIKKAVYGQVRQEGMLEAGRAVSAIFGFIRSNTIFESRTFARIFSIVSEHFIFV